MKIICPKCEEIYNNSPEELIGRYVICQNCHHIFHWEQKIYKNSSETINGELKQGKKGDSNL